MSFVPFIPPPEQASPRAYELGRRITEAIESFRREQPDLKPEEIRQAARLALKGTGTGNNQIAVILGLLVVMAGLGVFLFMKSSGTAGGSMFPIVAIGAAIIILAVVFKTKRL